MITSQQLFPVGHIAKMHGTKGEVVVIASEAVAPEAIMDLARVVIEIDGIFVPFFVENTRSRGAEAVLMKFDEDAPKGADFENLPGKTLYALKEDLSEIDNQLVVDDDTSFYLGDLIGFSVVDSSTHLQLGKVTDFDDSTANVLLIVKSPDDRDLMIPVADELFVDINLDTETLVMNIPEGLIEIQ